MGIQIQPNCCGEAIYLSFWKLKSFTGYWESDNAWRASGVGVRCADGKYYYAVSASKKVFRVNASNAKSVAEIATVSTTKTLGTLRIANDEARLALVRAEQSGVGGGVEYIGIDLDTGAQVSFDTISTSSYPGRGIYGCVNVEHGKVAWLQCEGGFGTNINLNLKSANYDGSSVATTATLYDTSGVPGSSAPGTSIAVDYSNQRYYFAWTRTAQTDANTVRNHGTIWRVNWDGSDFQQVFSIFSNLYPSGDPLNFLTARIYDVQVHRKEGRLYYLLSNNQSGTLPPADANMGIRSIKLDGSDDRLEWHASRLPHPNDVGKSTGARFSGAGFQLGEGLIKIDRYY